jgi:hypothetical protein
MEGRDRSTLRTAAEPAFGVQADNRTGPRKSIESRMRMRIAVAEHTTKVPTEGVAPGHRKMVKNFDFPIGLLSTFEYHWRSSKIDINKLKNQKFHLRGWSRKAVGWCEFYA